MYTLILAIRQYTREREDYLSQIKIIRQYLLKPTGDIVKQIVDNTCSNLQQCMLDEEYLKKINNIHSLNDTTYEINYYIFHMIGDLTKQYISSYEIDKATNNIVEQEFIF